MDFEYQIKMGKRHHQSRQILECINEDIPVKKYYYNDHDNTMVDIDGFEVHDIFNIVSPNMWYLFKQSLGYLFVKGVKKKEWIELWLM